MEQAFPSIFPAWISLPVQVIAVTRLGVDWLSRWSFSLPSFSLFHGAGVWPKGIGTDRKRDIYLGGTHPMWMNTDLKSEFLPP